MHRLPFRRAGFAATGAASHALSIRTPRATAGSEAEVTKVGQPNSNMDFRSCLLPLERAPTPALRTCGVSDLLSSLGSGRQGRRETRGRERNEVGHYRVTASRQVVLIQDPHEGA